jgi:hypothetical protein
MPAFWVLAATRCSNNRSGGWPFLHNGAGNNKPRHIPSSKSSIETGFLTRIHTAVG